MTVLIHCRVPQQLSAILAPCSVSTECKNQVVQMEFLMLDPNERRIAGLLPMSEYTYGQTVMSISIVNLPTNTSADELLVQFLVNVSCIGLDHDQDGRAVARVIIPSASSPGNVQIKVHLLKWRQTLLFSDSFSYLAVPPPAMLKFTPTSAPASAASRVRVSLRNFPRISATSDIKIQFRSGELVADARVLGFFSDNSEPQALENLQVDIETPNELPVGFASISAFHTVQQVTASISKGFILLDMSSPKTSRITGPEGTVADLVRVPMSESTEITAIIENVPREVDVSPSLYIAQNGDAVLPILAAQVVEGQVASVTLSTFPRAFSGLAYVIVAFGGEGCSSDCCANMTCALLCPGVKSACFAMVYFDDKLPSLKMKSDVTGPEIGGDILKFEIQNFPILASDKDVQLKYGLDGMVRYFEDVMVVFSDAVKTELIAITPNFRQQCVISGSKQIDVLIEPKDDPRKSVKVAYTILAVRTELAYVSSTLGPSSGGVEVLSEMSYFPYPVTPLVFFGDRELTVQVLSMSDPTSTFIKFVTPATAVGTHQVRIMPKTCAMPCRNAVQFQFEHFDTTLPEPVSPVPSAASFQLKSLPPIILRNTPPDSEISHVSVDFEDEDGYAFSSTAINETSVGGAARSFTIITPDAITAPGDFAIHIKFHLKKGILKQVQPIPFKFYDGYAMRTIEVSPGAVPTSALVDGRELHLHHFVRVLLSNVPQDLTTSDVSAVLSTSSKICPVTSVRHIVSCDAFTPDCNRTLLQIQSPVQDYPGSQELVISRIVPGEASEQLVKTSVDFVQPCNGDFDGYCRGMNLITNFKLLADRPTTECNSEYCLDPELVGQPVVLDYFPTEGSKAGGTLVTVIIKDLPAFSASDVSVRITSSISAEITPVVGLVVKEGSSLAASESTLSFLTPSFSSQDEVGQVTISTMVAGQKKHVSFPFEFLPVITGRAEITPARVEVFEGQDLKVKLVLTNAPKLYSPFKSNDIIVMVNSTEIVNSAVVLSSDRYSTTVQITIYNADLDFLAPGQVSCAIGARLQGREGLGVLLIAKKVAPSPSIVSIYPPPHQQMQPDLEHLFTTKVAYLEQTRLADFSVNMTTTSGQTYNVELVGVVEMMSSECKHAYCSMLELKVLIPLLTAEDQRAPTIGLVEIWSFSQQAMMTSFEVKFMAIGHPLVKALEPASLHVLGSGVDPVQHVTVYIENFPNVNCKYSANQSCAQQALQQGLQAHAITLQQGQGAEGRTYPRVVGAVDVGGMLAVSLHLLSQKKACDVTFHLNLSSSSPPSPSVDFSIRYNMPLASVSPVDGSRAGSDVITISARGWYDNSPVSYLPSPSNDTLRLHFGDAQVEHSNILSVTVEDAVLTIVCNNPPSNTAGDIVGSIVGNVDGTDLSSQFYFTYFNPPRVLSVVPSRATLSGRTDDAQDFRSVLLRAEDFPHVASAEELLVTVGAETAQVTSVRSSTDGTKSFLAVRIRVPEIASPGKAIITVELRQSDIHRQPKRLQSALTYFQPLPIVTSSLWCKSCPSSGVCITMDRCADGSEPLVNLLPKSGEQD